MITVANENIKINPTELRARLHRATDEKTLALAEECRANLFKSIKCAYCFKETAAELYSDGCDLGFGMIKSKNLRKNLDGCKRAYVFAATIGLGADRAINAAAAISPLRQFVMDAVASAAIEALCDYAQDRLPAPTGMRFSPGYGDFDISLQRPLLEFIDAYKQIGVTLTQSGLMTPTKSVSAIMGIRL